MTAGGFCVAMDARERLITQPCDLSVRQQFSWDAGALQLAPRDGDYIVKARRQRALGLIVDELRTIRFFGRAYRTLVGCLQFHHR